MGNPDGRTWLTKTQQQKQQDIQKYFHKSKIPEIERRIEQTQEAIKTCEQRIERLYPLSIQEQIVDTKMSAQKVKEEIAKVQREIEKVKRNRKARKNRIKARLKRAIEEYQETLLTEEQMIAIIKYGTINEDK